MTPRERVLTSLRHREPDRAPFSWGLQPTPEMQRSLEAYCGSRGYSFAALMRATEEIRSITPAYIGPELSPRTDYWGIRRAPVSYGAGEYNEIDHHPLAAIEDPPEIEDSRWPSPDWFDFPALAPLIRAADPDHAYAHRAHIAISGNPLEIYTWMTGLEQTLVNLLVNKPLVHAAMGRITSFFESMIERAVEAVPDYIDIFYFADDLGGQSTLLFSRETYREMIQPYHRRLIEHSKRLLPLSHAMYHSDGAVFEVLPDLIDAGVQIQEAVQVDAAGMEPARLKSAYGDRLSFHGGISVQSLLPNAAPEQVRDAVAQLVATLGAGGGYIAAPTHSIQTGTPPENVLAMLEAVLGEEGLARAIEAAGAHPADARPRGDS